MKKERMKNHCALLCTCDFVRFSGETLTTSVVLLGLASVMSTATPTVATNSQPPAQQGCLSLT